MFITVIRGVFCNEVDSCVDVECFIHAGVIYGCESETHENGVVEVMFPKVCFVLCACQETWFGDCCG